MNAAITVRRDSFGDWEMSCREHGDQIVATFWDDAYEAALGHACMKHPTPPCAHPITYQLDGDPSTTRCLDCYAPQPAPTTATSPGG